MELRQLRYFLAVAEERNLTRAAEVVGIRPTSLSQQIIALERELGAALFVRSPAGMTPTQAGARLVGHARTVVESAQRARESIQQRPGLRLAVTPGAPPWCASALWRAAGEVAPEIADMQTAEQLTRLRDGALDAGVLLLPADLSGLQAVTIEDTELGVVVARDHRLVDRKVVRWDDLDGCSLSWFARSWAPGYYDAIRETWSRAGWHPVAVRESAPRRGLFGAELAHGGNIVALRPAWDVGPNDGLAWLPFAADAPRIRYALVWNAADSAAARYRSIAADLVATATPHTRAVLPRGQGNR
ncbi:LysR family transcriptional regulator [Nocardia ninae]|uniref:LysR family transcriptional regulator n=1 Tax=Nocardia ninae NBRC 108245 TaxID=1210091 RepID=A0A511MCT3_9NOCA|nr:LysR family transcriptional regulator [Nocardia ninae]GEM38399.1 LysR family transcriptional regulator [Nocardia ninae NBRC 108245]